MSTFQGFGRCNNSTALSRYVPCCAVTDIKISCSWSAGRSNCYRRQKKERESN